MDAGEQMAVAGVDGVHLRVVAAGKPEHAAVGRHAAHVGAPTTRERPLLRDLAQVDVDHGDGALAAVRSVEIPGVAAEVEAVRALAGGDEAKDAEGLAIDYEDTVGLQCGHAE